MGASEAGSPRNGHFMSFQLGEFDDQRLDFGGSYFQTKPESLVDQTAVLALVWICRMACCARVAPCLEKSSQENGCV